MRRRLNNVRFSLRYQVAAILLCSMLVIEILSNSLFYYITKAELQGYAVKETKLVAEQIRLEIVQSEQGESYIDNLLGNELRMAAVAIEHQLPKHVSQVTNAKLVYLSKELGVSGITLFQPTKDDIVGVRSSDPKEIGLSTKGMSKWYTAFQDVWNRDPQASKFGTAGKDYWSGPFSNATSDPTKVNKWGYYYDGTTDYMIDPYFVSTSITDYQKEVGIDSFIKKVQSSNSDILSIAVLNNSFGKKPINYQYGDETWVDISNEPVMYGTYAYQDKKLDVAEKNKACLTQRVVSVEDTVNGMHVLKTFVPDSLNGSKYVVEVVTNYRLVSGTLQQLWYRAVCVSIFLFLIILVLSLAGAEFLARPLRRITETVDEIGSRNFGVQLSVRRSDEIGVLADHVNAMSENLLRYLRELAVQERGKGVNYLVMATHALVHELGNPLVSIKYLTEFLPRVQPDLNDKAKEVVARMKSSSDYATRISREFSDFLKNGRLDFRRRNVIDILDEAVAICAPIAQSNDTTLDFVNGTSKKRIPLEVDRDKLLAAFVNVIKNGVDSIDETCSQRWVRVELTIQGSELQIDVIDSGIGIPKEQWESIFMPYRSTKKTGLGLGLTFSGFVVLAHGGVIQVLNSDEHGTTMRVRLPMEE